MAQSLQIFPSSFLRSPLRQGVFVSALCVVISAVAPWHGENGALYA